MKHNICIIDGRASDEIISNIEKLGMKVIRTIECREINIAVSYHPDMVLFPIEEDLVVVAPNVYDYYKSKLEAYGIEVVRGEYFLREDYPGNIAYNAARMGDMFIHNLKYTDSMIKELIKEKNIELLDVKQGYSKCSLGIISEELGITSDIKMYNKLMEKGRKMLLIEPGHIILKGYDYGFIGGTMGVYKNKVLFSGSLKNHPNYDDIFRFIEENNRELVELSNDEIIDLGTIYCL